MTFVTNRLVTSLLQVTGIFNVLSQSSGIEEKMKYNSTKETGRTLPSIWKEMLESPGLALRGNFRAFYSIVQTKDQ